MAMSLGFATVHNDGTVSQNGVIGRFYDEIIAPIAGVIPAGVAGIPLKQAVASQATIMGTVVFEILTIDARAEISPENTGLQRMPASTAENTDCKGPSDFKYLSIV